MLNEDLLLFIQIFRVIKSWWPFKVNRDRQRWHYVWCYRWDV